MDFHIGLHGRKDLARQVYRQIRAAILEGRLRRGSQVPPTRELAQRLDIARNTVSLAYEWLIAEGLLSGRRGAGSFVEGNPLARLQRPKGVRIRWRTVWDRMRPPAQRKMAARYDFGVGMPDASLFPSTEWRRLLARHLRRSALTAEYGDPAGHQELRAAIARYVGVNRGVIADAEDVVITDGAQGAFDLIARVLIEPGARVAVEEPGYPPPRLLFESYGARVAPIPVDEAGLDVSALPDDARLVYVTPTHQFPLGMPMLHARRAALLAWANRCNAVIIEDDYDSEFRFSGRPLDTLQAMDRSGRVIYVGSFSKSLLPALRLGFLVSPSSLRDVFRTASYVSGWHTHWPAQAALASFIEDGYLARHVRKARRAYSARHELILRILDKDFAHWLTLVPSVTGMHLTARIRSASARMEKEIADRARAESVGFDRLSTYYASRTGDSSQAGIALGYGAIAEAMIPEGLRRLRHCFATAGSASGYGKDRGQPPGAKAHAPDRPGNRRSIRRQARARPQRGDRDRS